MCMDFGNLTWVDSFPGKALQQMISLYMEEGMAIQLCNHML